MWWLALAVATAAIPEIELPSLEAEAYFVGGPFAPARRLVSQGAFGRAARLLKRLLKQHPDAAERPQARYLLGLSLIRSGDYAEAAALFAELSQTYPALRDDHTYYRGQALYLWGSYLDAAQVWAQVAADGPWADRARRLRAWALLKATDFRRVTGWLEGLDPRHLDDELTFVLAAARLRVGDVVGSYRAYRSVWRTSARPDLAGPALAEMSRLKVDERWLMPERVARIVQRSAPGLRRPGGFNGALNRLEAALKMITAGRALRAEIAFARGRVAEAKRRMAAAARWYAAVGRRAPDGAPELLAAAGLAEGRALEAIEREADSLVAYRRVARDFPDRPEAEQALFRAADLLLRVRRYDDAKEACQQLLVSNPVTRFRRRCLWNVAWAEYRLGRSAQARQFLATLVRGPLPADLDAAARYWLGRAEADLGRPDEARQQWRQVLERHPLGYYAALAERQLILAPAADPTARRGDDGALSSTLAKAVEYQRLGLAPRALAQAAAYEGEIARTHARPSVAAYRALAGVYERFRRFRDARRVREAAARVYAFGPGAEEEFVAAARRAHPLKFESPIRKAARAFDLPPSLLFALIRTESGFKPDAVSAMDAYGLAQLILPTAQRVGRRIRAGRVTRRRLLTDPDLNVRIGAAYLRQLLDLYDWSEPFALAAYNAGPHAVDAWRRRRVRRLSGVAGAGVGLAPSAEEFAEEIPVQETRRFVKAVLSRARAYAVLYPDESPPAPVEAPPPAPVAALIEPDYLPEPPAPQYALPGGVMLWTEDALADPDRALAGSLFISER